MSGLFPASLFRLRAPLALGLCLLAFLFTIEAKTAWYGPSVGLGGSVRAAKAQPAATTRIVEHGVPAPDPSNPHGSFGALPPIAISQLSLRFSFQARSEIHLSRFSQFAAAGFSFSSLFRPPPAL